MSLVIKTDYGLLEVENKDSSNEARVEVDCGVTLAAVYINKQQAIQIIEHLQEQFKI